MSAETQPFQTPTTQRKRPHESPDTTGLTPSPDLITSPRPGQCKDKRRESLNCNTLASPAASRPTSPTQVTTAITSNDAIDIQDDTIPAQSATIPPTNGTNLHTPPLPESRRSPCPSPPLPPRQHTDPSRPAILPAPDPRPNGARGAGGRGRPFRIRVLFPGFRPTSQAIAETVDRLLATVRPRPRVEMDEGPAKSTILVTSSRQAYQQLLAAKEAMCVENRKILFKRFKEPSVVVVVPSVPAGTPWTEIRDALAQHIHVRNVVRPTHGCVTLRHAVVFGWRRSGSPSECTFALNLRGRHTNAKMRSYFSGCGPMPRGFPPAPPRPAPGATPARSKASARASASAPMPPLSIGSGTNSDAEEDYESTSDSDLAAWSALSDQVRRKPQVERVTAPAAPVKPVAFVKPHTKGTVIRIPNPAKLPAPKPAESEPFSPQPSLVAHGDPVTAGEGSAPAPTPTPTQPTPPKRGRPTKKTGVGTFAGLARGFLS